MQRQKRFNIDFTGSRNRFSQRTNEATLIVGNKSSDIDKAIKSLNTDTTSLNKDNIQRTENKRESLVKSKTILKSQPQSTLRSDVSDKKKVALGQNSQNRNEMQQLQQERQFNQPIQLSVKFHEFRSSPDNVLVDPSLIPGVIDGSIGEIECLQSSKKKLCFIFKSQHSNTASIVANNIHGNQNASSNNFISNLGNNSSTNTNNNFISIQSGPLSALMELKLRSQVLVTVRPKEAVEADTVEIFIKDIHLARGDMWNISSLLIDTCLYRGEKLSYVNGSIRAVVHKIYRNGHKLFSCYVGKNTKIVFRSESARLIVFIQISSEMWHFEESGQQMFHKLVNSLFPKAFQRWKDLGTHHLITIILFSSVDLDGDKSVKYTAGETPPNKTDYYRVVVDQVSILLWSEIMATLRLEFANFKKDILLHQNSNVNIKNPQEYLIQGNILPSVKGNLLEAVNLGMSLVCDDFKDPDLRQTTNHFIVITAGTGIFDVTYDMLIRTSKLMSTVDSTIDIICLSQPPLHVVPLVRYLDNQKKLKHCIPNWLDISFWSDSSQAVHQWLPRCKIYELQMMGVMENELTTININELGFSNYKSAYDAMVSYDQNVFLSPLHRKSNNMLDNKKNRLNYEISSFPSSISPKSGGISIQNTNVMKRSVSTASNSSGFQPSELVTFKTSSPTTSNARGVTTTSKSNVSAFSSLLSISQKTDNKNNNSNAFDFVRKIIRSPMLNPLSPGVNSIKEDNMKTMVDITLAEPGGDDKNILIDKHSTAGGAVSDSLSDNKNRPILPVQRNKRARRKSSGKKTLLSESSNILNNYWTNVENPSNAVTSELLGMVSHGRWKFVFPPNIRRRTIKWTSLTSPASLPIMTPNFPTVQDFNQNFTFRIYDVFLNQDNISANQSSESLMRSMISLRLSLGFQICIGDNVAKLENQRKPNGDAKMLVQYLDKNNYLGCRIYLSLANEIHRICCDYNGLVNVQVYKRISSTDELMALSTDKKYIEFIKTRYSQEYLPVTIINSGSDPRNYNWNQLDQVLAGYDESIDKQKYHRLKFVILPTDIPENSYKVSNEKLSTEEIRLEGIRSLIMSINKICFRSPEERKLKKKVEILPEITFYTGNLFRFLKFASHDFSNEQRHNLLFVAPRFNQSINLYKLAAALQSEKGIKIVDRKWHLKTHYHCFLGMELVSWLIENFEDIDTREDAVEFGNKLMEEHLFSHVISKHRFLDGHYFYSINKQYLDSSPNVQAASASLRDLNELNEDCNVKEISRKINIDNSSQRVFSNETSPIPFHPQDEMTTNDYLLRERSNSNAPSTSRHPKSLHSIYSPSISTNHDETRTVSSRNNSIHTTLNTQLNTAVNDSKSTNSEPTANQRRTIVLSRKVLSDLDPNGHSWQPELVNVHYDIVHNPEHCFHIRLEWLNTTSKLIEDTISGWAKHCERYGLSLVEIPWEELFTLPIRNPLHSTIEISLVFNPWIDSEFGKYRLIFENELYFFHLYLLEKCGFMLDNRTATYFSDANFDVTYSWGKPMFKYAQFIHSTGAYIAELRENGDFFLAPNNAHIARLNLNIGQTHLSNKSAVYFDSQSVMLEFRSICQDEEQLRSVFREAITKYEENDDDIEDFLAGNDIAVSKEKGEGDELKI